MTTRRKTKFILAGGFAGRSPDGGAAFCREVTAGLSAPVRVCECLFALPLENWHDSLSADREFFRRALPDVPLEFVRADQSSFLRQIEESDVIYFRGGSTEKLMRTLDSIDGWSDAIHGKTVVGSSAGAYMLSRHYLDMNNPGDLLCGFGLVPVTLVAHYRSSAATDGYIARKLPDWDEVDSEMSRMAGEAQVLKLREGEFCTYYL